MPQIENMAAEDAISDSLVSPEGITGVVGINPETGEMDILPVDVNHIEGTGDWKTDEPGSMDIELENAEEQGELSPADFDGDYDKWLEWRDARNEAEEARQDGTAEEAVQELADEQRNELAQQFANEQVQTPETYSQTIERLDLKNKESDAIAGELAQYLGAKSDTSEQMADLLRVTALSAATHGPQAISQQVGDAWASKFYSAIGLDPRLSFELAPWQKTYMAGTTHNAFANVEQTCVALESQGITPTVEAVNSDPRAAILFGRHFFAGAAGIDPDTIDNLDPSLLSRIDQASLRQGDKLVSFYLDMRNRAYQSQQQQRQSSQRTQASGKRRASVQSFRTNSDIFDEDTMKRLANERRL